MSRIILAESYGQLGNQLFLFAHLIALSEELGLPVYNAPFMRYREHFIGSRQGLVPGYDPLTGRFIPSRYAGWPPGRSIYPHGPQGDSCRKETP